MSISDFRIALPVFRLKQVWLHSLFWSGFGPRAGMHKSWVPGWQGFVHPRHRVSILCRAQSWRGYILVVMVRGTGGLHLTWHAENSMLQPCPERCTEGPHLGVEGLFQTYRLKSGMWSYGSSFTPPWHRYPFSLTNKPSLLPTFFNGKKKKPDSWPYCTWFCLTPCWQKWARMVF
jgi:hypothetical protein